MKKTLFTLSFIVFIVSLAKSQYEPAAGKPGSTAIFRDSSIFVNWANNCKIIRGWKNIAQKDSGFASIGDSISATGKAGETGTVSLGDSGIALCTFPIPITDGNGWDFAVFENAFDDSYLELAFVEISSDGIRYFRFPCHSLSDTAIQTESFGLTNPEKINNLAGKYRSGYGTPFDISQIADYKDLDKNNIKYVKIVDVVGSLNSKYASFDTAMRKINDPYPTPFASGGFDLDAIGVINQISLDIKTISKNKISVLAANPISENQNLIINGNEKLSIMIYDSKGDIHNILASEENSKTINYIELPTGLFFIKITNKESSIVYKGFRL